MTYADCERSLTKNMKGKDTLVKSFSREVLFSLSLAVTVEFDPG